MDPMKPVSWSPSTSSSIFSSPNAFKLFPHSTPTPPHRAMGYFAFPPNSYLPVHPEDSGIEEQRKRREEQDKEKQQKRAAQESAWEERLKNDGEVRQQRLAREEAEARRGEEEWVRSGGILRDAEGKRDMKRTQAVRDELKLRDIEEGLIRKWERYENGWKMLVNGTGSASVRFQDIPWPIDMEGLKAVDVSHLTTSKVEEFLLGGLKVRGNRITKKERVRNSLLRWHPDKMTAILARVVDQDKGAVKEGINAVMACLQQLNSKL